MTIELKPCPFCGGQANLRVTTSGVSVRCRKCSIGTPYRLDSIDKSDAIRKVVEDWNRREEGPKAIGVTRCKDCKHRTDDIFGYCDVLEQYISDGEFFCGCGERRENNE